MSGSVPPIVISLFCCAWFWASFLEDRRFMSKPYGSLIMLLLSLLGLAFNVWRLLHGG